MAATTHQEIDVLGAVVDGVEAPEEGNFVAPTMAPIDADLPDDKRGDDPKPGGPCRHRRSESAGNRAVNELSHKRQRSAQQKADSETAEENR